jgi:hypothetical protein
MANDLGNPLGGAGLFNPPMNSGSNFILFNEKDQKDSTDF